MLDSIAVVGLSSFGLAYILRYTEGPFGLFVTLRGLLGLRRYPVIDERDEITDYVEESDNGFFAKLISCFWCLSVWIALLFSILVLIATAANLLSFPLIWFGAVAISGLLHRIIEG